MNIQMHIMIKMCHASRPSDCSGSPSTFSLFAGGKYQFSELVVDINFR